MITCGKNEGAANAASGHFFILLVTPLGDVKRHKGDEVLLLLHVIKNEGAANAASSHFFILLVHY